jgi:hypothetical protein
MCEQKIETRLNIDPENIRTAKFIEPRYSQSCMLCDNTREIPHPSHYSYPWVCDECREAIAFVKDFRTSVKEVSAEQSKEIKASIVLL